MPQGAQLSPLRAGSAASSPRRTAFEHFVERRGVEDVVGPALELGDSGVLQECARARRQQTEAPHKQPNA